MRRLPSDPAASDVTAPTSLVFSPFAPAYRLRTGTTEGGRDGLPKEAGKAVLAASLADTRNDLDDLGVDKSGGGAARNVRTEPGGVPAHKLPPRLGDRGPGTAVVGWGDDSGEPGRCPKDPGTGSGHHRVSKSG